MSRSPRQAAAAVLARIERAARHARLALVRSSGGQAQTERPNDAAEWDRVYAGPITPVTRLASPVARVLEDLSRPGEVLLEAGCGSGSISAELATVKRVIELADFSQPILDRASALFAASDLPAPVTKLADLTKPLPWPDRSVDITWSSGVLEHWTDDELVPIVREMARISRRRVVSLVPYAGNVLYRWGKWAGEQNGQWPYGRELPRQTQRPVFERAGLRDITESTVWPEVGAKFLGFVDPELRRLAEEWWASLPADDPLHQTQGYLLLTVGEVA